MFIRALTAAEAERKIPVLADILVDCVEGGASVSFMAPLSCEKASAFWRGIAEDVAMGRRILLIALDKSSDNGGDSIGGQIVGTVQVILHQPENQPHRADIAKMLVRRSARRRGIGAALMRAAEDAARNAGKTLLVLDTVTGAEGERLYERLGWIRVGVIPDYALWPDGRPCATTVFYRQL